MQAQRMAIGELSRRTGVSVKTIRYYSEIGLVPEAARTGAGYRVYDTHGMLRLQFVRSLRELGFDLRAIRDVLEKRASLPAAAAAHADVIDAQIRVLTLRRAVLRRLAKGDGVLTDKEIDRMNQLAQASADERRRIMNEFLDEIFADVPVSPQFEQMFRQAMPDLPDEPTDEQVDAWVELAGLVQDPDFKSSLRRMGRAAWGEGERPRNADPAASQRGHETVLRVAGEALGAGVDPASDAAAPLLDEIVAAMAEAAGQTDTPGFRRQLAGQTEAGGDPRAARYWELLAIINGWPPRPSAASAASAAYGWVLAALRARQG